LWINSNSLKFYRESDDGVDRRHSPHDVPQEVAW
jgi:hypothetical protein